MNQFHTPSFGDEVFEMNDSPMEQTQNQTSSRRISTISSLDHSTLDDEEDQVPYVTANTYASNMLSANQHPPQQQQQLVPQQQTAPQQSHLTQATAKPLAAYALFFRDTMTAIKQQNPACTLEQIKAIALNMWESMDEKQKGVYDQRHDVEKREYLLKLRDAQRNQWLEETSPQQPQQDEVPPSVPVSESETNSTPIAETPDTEKNSADVLSQPPDQIQLLTEAAAVQKCTRDQCNKPAIINPDWEDEYCSNECVVIHCHNVFTEWARSLQNSPT